MELPTTLEVEEEAVEELREVEEAFPSSFTSTGIDILRGDGVGCCKVEIEKLN